MKKKRRPYSGSTADPTRAQRRIREMLQQFGVQRVAFDEDFEHATLAVMFKYNDYPVRLPVDYGKLAHMYIDDDPWTSRKRVSEEDWIHSKREIAYRAAFSLLEDFLKGLVTMVEMEVFSFEEIFISYFTNNQGQRFGEVFVKRLPEFMAGKALMPGKG